MWIRLNPKADSSNHNEFKGAAENESVAKNHSRTHHPTVLSYNDGWCNQENDKLASWEARARKWVLTGHVDDARRDTDEGVLSLGWGIQESPAALRLSVANLPNCDPSGGAARPCLAEKQWDSEQRVQMRVSTYPA